MGNLSKSQPDYINGVCLVHVEHKTLSPNARILSIPSVIHDVKTRVRIISAQPFSYPVAIHASCQCNELLALYNRHCIDRSYLKFNLRDWKRAAKLELPYEELDTLSLFDVVRSYSGPKRAQYRSGYFSLMREGWSEWFTRIKMFIKPDRYSQADIGSKMPRAIQFRSKEYNLCLASYLKPVEEFVYNEIKINDRRVICKGLSPMARGHLVYAKLQDFVNPVYFEIDHSKFDSTVRVEHLKSLHKYYQRFYPRDQQLRKLLRHQLNNKGVTKSGIKYEVKGTRMSGDFDTGLGNSIINYWCLRGWLRRCGFKKFDIVLDGDDSIVIVEKNEEYKAKPGLFEHLGFETKFFVKYDIHQVDFCQSRLMITPFPNFVRSPLRALSHTNVVLRSYGKKTYLEWAAGIGRCELSLNPGVPILQVLGLKLSTCSQRFYFDESTKWRMGSIKTRMKFHVITDQSRYEFYRCWGIDPAMQEAIEDGITAPSLLMRDNSNESTNSTLLSTASDRFQTLCPSIDECWSQISWDRS